MSDSTEEQEVRESLDPQPSVGIEASGSVTDEIVTVKLKLGQARLKLKWSIDETDDIDTLVASLTPAVERVLDELLAQQAADRG